MRISGLCVPCGRMSCPMIRVLFLAGPDPGVGGPMPAPYTELRVRADGPVCDGPGILGPRENMRAASTGSGVGMRKARAIGGLFTCMLFAMLFWCFWCLVFLVFGLFGVCLFQRVALIGTHRDS
ncbi:hypothetical protein METBIDRAFT_197051 [Metschnikowia bicuspidata var. bicuspidata NRRL YB-4993]|uniref:Uncharacterized protein n=1 Tax=Metschnikowia bicuspidata var. bicuspidata NRRL YB-4993 TaxID=869754 RepID=A0A1A0H909_9ASCO|nr:hypothetical protein METBIDRAFT_197051 [Metschnikowia bicuspidata var. bicuspidata NRRL YB-4993]OBA20367.1 hypothetical protein METBIDRAFT_197051 [Metschnikowia bicuspidata var. bicuspidata NRRL YB-4993]